MAFRIGRKPAKYVGVFTWVDAQMAWGVWFTYANPGPGQYHKIQPRGLFHADAFRQQLASAGMHVREVCFMDDWCVIRLASGPTRADGKRLKGVLDKHYGLYEGQPVKWYFRPAPLEY